MNGFFVIASLLLPAQAEAVEEVRPAESSTSVSASETTVAATISSIAENLREADRGLSAGQTGGETLAAQQKAVEELQKLIDAAKSNAQANASNSSTSTQQRGSAGESAREEESSSQSSPQGGTAAQQAEKSATSDENATAPAGSSNPLHRFRASVVRDAWGHLPQRLRDQLLNAGSDKYLPKYDGLVRDYFESLATPASEKPTLKRDGGTP